MSKGYRSSSLVCVAAAAMYSMSAAAADEQAASPQSGLEEIVVTAEKRQEREIDVPISISAISTEDLVTQNITQMRDFYSRVPGLQYNGDTTYALSLRGVTTGGATNPTIAILLDDVQFDGSKSGK